MTGKILVFFMILICSFGQSQVLTEFNERIPGGENFRNVTITDYSSLILSICQDYTKDKTYSSLLKLEVNGEVDQILLDTGVYTSMISKVYPQNSGYTLFGNMYGERISNKSKNLANKIVVDDDGLVNRILYSNDSTLSVTFHDVYWDHAKLRYYTLLGFPDDTITAFCNSTTGIDTFDCIKFQRTPNSIAPQFLEKLGNGHVAFCSPNTPFYVYSTSAQTIVDTVGRESSISIKKVGSSIFLFAKADSITPSLHLIPRIGVYRYSAFDLTPQDTLYIRPDIDPFARQSFEFFQINSPVFSAENGCTYFIINHHVFQNQSITNENRVMEVYCIDSSGNYSWSKKLPQTGHITGQAVGAIGNKVFAFYSRYEGTIPNGELKLHCQEILDTTCAEHQLVVPDLVETYQKATLYPNPAEDLINVSFSLPTTGKLQILDMRGVHLHSYPIVNQINHQLEIDSIEPGTYFLVLKTGVAQILLGQFVKL